VPFKAIAGRNAGIDSMNPTASKSAPSPNGFRLLSGHTPAAAIVEEMSL